jgi:biopolymer transport protein ExbB
MGFGKTFFGVLILLIFVTGGPLSAEAWWDAKWKYRKKITLDTSAQGADIKEALTDFPVLIRLHSGNFNFANAKNDGSDIRFLAPDDKTPLKFHAERYDPAEEMVLLWVRIPRLSPASTQDFIWMYYGNPAAPAAQDPGGTYDPSQLLVYHLGEKEGVPKDSTAYQNHPREFAGKLNAAAAVGRGASFSGKTDRLTIGKSPSLVFSKGFTFSAWVRLAGPQEDARLISWDDGKQAALAGIAGTKLYWSFPADKKKPSLEKAVDLPAQKWVHVTLTADPIKGLIVYTDGRERASVKLPGPLPDPASDVVIGGSLKGEKALTGDLDEVRISGVARSAAWVRADAAGQGPETMLLSYLDEETASSGGLESLTIHLLIVTARSITLDGWIVIGILVIMGCMATIVFLDKLLKLRRTKKDNSAFLNSFSSSANFRTLKEREGDFENSSLFRVYCTGMEELERRVEKTEAAGGRKSLPVQAVTAFKAALDRASLQESRKSTAGLLVLTLSISGGPFMGLLGTVWGVINTFAGVAEAGEANLAAIAPGVASALSCTLMGLLVAIPALFAYSYLSSEIKNSMAEMNVFTAEFLTRVEEEYGGKA